MKLVLKQPALHSLSVLEPLLTYLFKQKAEGENSTFSELTQIPEFTKIEELVKTLETKEQNILLENDHDSDDGWGNIDEDEGDEYLNIDEHENEYDNTPHSPFFDQELNFTKHQSSSLLK